jgi:hypothetical protein
VVSRRCIRWRFLTAAWLVSLAPASTHAADDVPPPPAARTVAFNRDILPIFVEHCLHCHGPDRQQGSLRLDRREHAARNGHTGTPVLGGDVHSNAILQRVSDADPRIRMPKDGPPLQPAQIQMLRAWVEQGTPWIDPPDSNTAPHRADDAQTRYAFARDDLRDWNPLLWSDARIDWYWLWIRRFFIPLLASLLFIGLCERSREWSRQQRPWLARPPGRVFRLLAGVPRSFYLVPLLAIAVVFSAWYYQDQATTADREIAALQARLRRYEMLPDESVATETRAVRPNHPPRLGGEYYRGNDERSASLFNGGFYRTATMRVALCDNDRRELHWNDAVTGSQFLVRFQVEQSPFTTPLLFNDAVWSDTFLSDVPPGGPVDDPDEQLVRFTSIAGGLWEAWYPIAVDAGSAEPSTGRIYIYRGPINDGKLQAQPHYAAEFSLLLRDGRIADTSELWMGYVLKAGNVFPVPAGTISEDEWFSFRPIPEIPHDQGVTDRKLLGLEPDRAGRRQ